MFHKINLAEETLIEALMLCPDLDQDSCVASVCAVIYFHKIVVYSGAIKQSS